MNSFEACLKQMGELTPDGWYYINSEKYRSFMFKEYMDAYVEDLRKWVPELDVSTYKKCMGVFRQISKKTNASFKYKIRYVSSTYYIDYYFFI
jgi:hypothetical protein